MSNYLMPVYFHQIPVAFEKGQGVWLWDTIGKKYLDALSGIAVCALGHAHPTITETIIHQSSKLLHTSNTYRIPLQEKLAEKLCAISGMEQVYFCNSGAEANETAIKMARLFGRKKGIENPKMVTFIDSFHGRSYATLSASGTARIRQGFEPLMSGFIHIPQNDLENLERLLREDKNIVAILCECIQGDGGIRALDATFIKNMRRLCDENEVLLMIDEVQTGLGRTGKWFAFQHAEILPDVVTIAKALGNGLPVGACLARGRACNLFGPGKHGSTFGGNPLVCAVGLSVLEVIEQESILQHVVSMGDYLLKNLQEVFQHHSQIIDIRGQGFMVGVELASPVLDLVQVGMKHGILFNIVANQVVRLLPSLIMKREEIDMLIQGLQGVVGERWES